MKSAVFFAEGFEECEGLIIVDLLRRGGQEIDTVSITSEKEVCSSHDVIVKTDRILSEVDLSSYDLLILPGGKQGVVNLENCTPLVEAVKSHSNAGKLTCAICAAPSILGHAGLLEGKKYTCFPSFADPSYGGDYQMELAVKDGNLITGRGMGATIEFSRMILNEIAPESLPAVEAGIQYEHTFRNL